jgi:hypothetical protein
MYSKVKTFPGQLLAAGSVRLAAVAPGLVVIKEATELVRVAVEFCGETPPLKP